ncbi:hypothetical protein ABC347_02135 [Sphingomonas sp. 1P06PA]|uniref:hypothetical protein n=1 Tax=Sphingomonas sp. 1P06PA TaxID=554121 RepID=UPI0039A4E85E
MVKLAMFSSTVAAESALKPPDCYDAVVEARLLRQTPSVFPETDDGSIVMIWPWFIELDVTRVVIGPATTGRVTALSLQHTKLQNGLRSKRFWLRRHSLGGYNLLRFVKADGIPRCVGNTQPTEPLIKPGSDQSLDSLQREGERAYLAEP